MSAIGLPSDLKTAEWFVAWVCVWGLIAYQYVVQFHEPRPAPRRGEGSE